MDHQMFIVRQGATYYGPFAPLELSQFLEGLDPPHETIPLIVPAPPGEMRRPLTLSFMGDDEAARRRDNLKIDSALTLKAMMWECYDARNAQRVFTAAEILRLWDSMFRVCRALESLIFHAEAAVADPSPEKIVALRKALWRYRDADDVDEHYRDRFW